MSIDQSTLDAVKDKKFTDFSNAVKQELKQKLSNHKDTKQYVSNYDKIQRTKDLFNQIAKTSEVPDNSEDE